MPGKIPCDTRNLLGRISLMKKLMLLTAVMGLALLPALNARAEDKAADKGACCAQGGTCCSEKTAKADKKTAKAEKKAAKAEKKAKAKESAPKTQ